jgi:hypothetical protein
MDVLPETACAMPTTNLQPKPTAEPKTAVLQIKLEEEVIGTGFISSSNLKIIL